MAFEQMDRGRHRRLAKAEYPPQFEPETTTSEGTRGVVPPIESGCLVAGVDKIPETLPVDEEEEVSDETLYRINVNAVVGIQIGNGVVEENAELTNLLEAQNERSATVCGDEDSLSDETLYRINVSALARTANREADCELVGEQNSIEDIEGGTEEVKTAGQLEQAEQFELGSYEEDSLFEVEEAKKVWNKGGISFDSSDDEEVIARLSGRKLQRKKRIEVRQETTTT
ncbi:hypothetical protein PIB30_063906 [Stylosanthes scabra]|uniref:Uncharacterized protein n=1 Tax=Stylosanthes scabra TaxID=79078 RepID=A0ABU6SLL1_9FABA|nr:hypothetical protein [Stylosanthes scabra]